MAGINTQCPISGGYDVSISQMWDIPVIYIHKGCVRRVDMFLRQMAVEKAPRPISGGPGRPTSGQSTGC